jgi:hypothetical protein
MTFENKGRISGFVTGVEVRQDGNAGGALRGQSADIIYIDEMDAIHEDILDKVIIPILFTWPNTMMFATSTPIGKVGKFYELCKQRVDFREDYFPTTVLPHWDVVREEIKNLSEDDDTFVSEYMAEFVESSSGVFKSVDVYAAMRDFTYEESGPDSEWWHKIAKASLARHDSVIVIGIDWNKNAGSEFVVVKWDVNKDKWYICDARNISPGQFNSIRFKEEVKRLNMKWKPDFIYADEGYGHHIIDDLLYEAHELIKNNPVTPFQQQTAKLKDRLKKFNFSQKVEINNPVDSTILEKTGKEFLVENAVRVFETQNIWFPSGDIVLRDQLLNYIVERRHASNNKPVYGMRSAKTGDHRLDALMLALGGVFLERNPLYSPNARSIQSVPGLLTKAVLERRSQDKDPDYVDMNTQGLHIEVTRIIRGGSEDTNNKIVTMRKLAEEVGKPFQGPKERHDFPGNTTRPKNAFEQLIPKSKSYNGYENDTRELYENLRRQETPQKRSDAFVFKKPGRRSRGMR